MTSMVYIRREGGTVSRLLLARRILLLAHQCRIRILPIFVSSEENLLADAASRFWTPRDWSLPLASFRQIVLRWTLPEIDLFASPASALILRYFAWGNAPDAEALDSLAQPWAFSLAYAFPPPALLLRVILKIAASSGVFLLVTPFWPAQKWFPAILALHILDIRHLPLSPEVIDLTSGLPPLRTPLPILVWKILGGFVDSPSRTPPFASSAAVGALSQRLATTPSGARSSISSAPTEFSSFPSI